MIIWYSSSVIKENPNFASGLGLIVENEEETETRFASLEAKEKHTQNSHVTFSESAGIIPQPYYYL